MNEHINFVENIYDSIKNPLGFICQKVNIVIGNNNYTIEYSNDD